MSDDLHVDGFGLQKKKKDTLVDKNTKTKNYFLLKFWEEKRSRQCLYRLNIQTLFFADSFIKHSSKYFFRVACKDYFHY